MMWLIDVLFNLACIAFGVWFGVMVGLQAIKGGEEAGGGSGDKHDLR